MKNVLSYNKFNFLNEEFRLNEENDFNQYQFGFGGMNPLSPGQGFATDSSLNIYGSNDSPYIDYYNRMAGTINNIKGIMKQIFNTTDFKLNIMNIDYFVEDIEEITNFKILRILENYSRNLDIYISFQIRDDEFFGVFKDFNILLGKPIFKTELYTDPRYNYIDIEYKLKLGNLFFKVLKNWFKPNKGLYTNLKQNNIVRDYMGKEFILKANDKIEVISVENDRDKN